MPQQTQQQQQQQQQHPVTTLAGPLATYLSSQTQAQSQPQVQVQRNTPETATTSDLCENCNARPKHVDGTQIHPFCGRRCAAAAQNAGVSRAKSVGAVPTRVRQVLVPSSGANTTQTQSGGSGSKRGRNQVVSTASQMCDHCKVRPKRSGAAFCGKACAQKAGSSLRTSSSGNVPATGGAAVQSSVKRSKSAAPAPKSRHPPAQDGCLLCGAAVHNAGHFCSKACSTVAEKRAPALLEVPANHKTFKSVTGQFKASWRHKTACPTVRKIYKVVSTPASVTKYEAYRSAIENRGHFAKAGKSAGNEHRRWHGTTRVCRLGDPGSSVTGATLCSLASCALCNILRTSYRVRLCGRKTGWGRFGQGIYTSATSSKSNDYSSNTTPSRYKVIILNKVIVGRGCKMTRDNTGLTAPPAGYDSVLAEAVPGGSLNYDELVCYTDDAIRPSYVVVYDA